MSNDPPVQASDAPKALVDEATRRRIEEALQNWNDPQSEGRRRFEEFRIESQELLRPLSDAIRASELLTDRDFAIRINTRD